MIRKKIIMLVLVAIVFTFLSTNSFAKVLLTHEQALKEMFPEADEIIEETKVASSDEIALMKERMGGRLVLYQKGSKKKELAAKNEFTFYFGINNGEKTGVAIMDSQPGKWGPVNYIIAQDMEGKVQNMAVMVMYEKRGRPIARRSFLKQFFGKGSTDQLKINKDIRAVSGATISSRSAAFAVKKVIVLYEELYINSLVSSKQE